MIHSSLSIVILVALWFHLPKSPTWYYIGVISAWSLVLISRILLAGYQGIARADIQDVGGAFKVTLKVTRLWNFKAGQYLYLRALDTANFMLLQSHPFCIVWWEKNTISLLVQQQTGISRDLHLLDKRSMLLEGPYGYEQKFGKFSHVVLLATDIGVAAILPYLKDLVTGHTNPTQKIFFIWIVSKDCMSLHSLMFIYFFTLLIQI